MMNSRCSNINSWFNRVYSNEDIKKPLSRKTIIITLVFIITLFFFNFLLRLNDQKYPEKDDYYYASETLFIKLLPQGRRTIEHVAQKSLLHFALVSPFVERNLNFFNVAKYINLIFGIIMILGVFFCGKYLFSDFTGLFAALFISLNSIVLERTMMLAPENLLILFSTLALLFWIKGFEKPIYWIGGGLFSILAFLAKSNGSFILAAFFLSLPVILIFRWRQLNPVSRYSSLITLIVFLSLVLFFYDMFFGYIRTVSLDLLLLKNTGKDITEFFGVQDYKKYPDFATYLSEDFQGFINKIILGIQRQLHKYSVGFFVSVQIASPEQYYFNTGYLLLPFYFYLLSKESSPERRIFYIVFSLVVFFGCVPRAAVGHGTARYSIMVTPIFFYILAPLIFHLMMKLKQRSVLWMRRAVAGLFAIALLVNIVIFNKAFKDFSFTPGFIPEFVWALNWIEKNGLKGDKFGRDSSSKLSYHWYVPWIEEEVASSSVKGKDVPDKKIVNFFRKKKVKYIIIDSVTSFSPYDKSKSKHFFKKHIKKKAGHLEVDKEALSQLGLEIAAQDHKQSNGILILRIKEI